MLVTLVTLPTLARITATHESSFGPLQSQKKERLSCPPNLTRHSTHTTMLDINDFIAERGGDVKKIKESQRRRHAPEEVVDEVIAMFEDHRKCRLSRVTERSMNAADALFLYSPICRKSDQDRDQRTSKRDWPDQEGQGQRRRLVEEEGRAAGPSQAAGGDYQGHARCSVEESKVNRQLRPRLCARQRQRGQQPADP